MSRSTRLIICQIYIQRTILYVSVYVVCKLYVIQYTKNIVKCQTKAVRWTFHGQSNITTTKVNWTELLLFSTARNCNWWRSILSNKLCDMIIYNLFYLLAYLNLAGIRGEIISEYVISCITKLQARWVSPGSYNCVTSIAT